MIVLHVGRSKRATKPRMPLGEFESTVEDIRYDEDYVCGTTVRITYALRKEGQKTEESFSERFFWDENNERTAQFLNYLDEQGVAYTDEGLPAIIGMREHLVIKKRPTSRGSALPSIESRSFISLPSSEA